jgi:hypothetical protein
MFCAALASTVSQAGQDCFALIAETLARQRERPAPVSLWDNLINHPLEDERREKCQKTPGSNAQETCHMQMQEWPDLL